MFKQLAEPDYCAPLLAGTSGTIVLNCILPVITGPNFPHWLNLAAFAFTLTAAVILFRNFSGYSLLKKGMLLVHLLANLFFCTLLAYYKYGYFGQHYITPFYIEA